MSGIVYTQKINTSPSAFSVLIQTVLTGISGNPYLHQYPKNRGEILIVKRYWWKCAILQRFCFQTTFLQYFNAMKWADNLNVSNHLTSLNLITFSPSHNLALSLVVVHMLLQVSGQSECFLKSHQCHVSRAKKS